VLNHELQYKKHIKQGADPWSRNGDFLSVVCVYITNNLDGSEPSLKSL